MEDDESFKNKNFKSIVDNLDEDEKLQDIYKYFYGSDNDSDSDEDVDNEDGEEDIVIGIDLGTTNSCVSIIRNKMHEIIPDEYGNRTIPSIVSYTNLTEYVGIDAKNQLDLNPENTYFETKRLIGRNFDDISVQNDLPFLSYGVIKDQKNSVILKGQLNKRKPYYTPEEIAASVLRKLKHMAEDYLKKKVKRAVITVPAYFNDSQRQATKDAAVISGLDCIRIINEPTAAALMYGLKEISINKSKDMNVLVYDNGGGTVDCSILCISDGIFEVLSSTGNTHLGGADFDNALVSYCKAYFKKKYKIGVFKGISNISLQKLRKACERAKKILSVDQYTTIMVTKFYEGNNLCIKITRSKFEKICRDLLIMCLKPVKDALDSAELEIEDIDDIILVGGTTRMPIIRNNLQTFFKGKPPNGSINPDEVVAAGAAIQAYILSHEDDPFSESILLLDILPLSLGIKTIGGEMNVIVPRNSRIPTTRCRHYTTDSDYQDNVTIDVYEGERKMTKDNFLIGSFNLEGIKSEPRGMAEIDIKFSVDINGIINVTAIDMKNDENKNSISIRCNNNRLTKEEINKLVKEAENLHVSDNLKRQKKRLYYEINDLCGNVNTNLLNDEFKLKENDRNLVIEDIKKVSDWLNKESYDNRDPKEYERVIERIKKRYGTLILKITGENKNVKENADTNQDINATTVYQDDHEEENNMFEKVEDDEMGIDEDLDKNKKETLRNLRNHIVDVCNSVYDIISSGGLNIPEDHLSEIKDYIDDLLLWVHVKQKITPSEYQDKIDEVNKMCNEAVDKYGDKTLFEEEAAHEIDKKDELEHLCYAIKSSVDNNFIHADEKEIQKLDKSVGTILDWLIDIDIKKLEISDVIYQEKIDDINFICDEIYKEMIKFKVNTSTSMVQTELSSDLPGDTMLLGNSDNIAAGTSIADLIKHAK